MNELTPYIYYCGSCGEENETLIDPSGGNHQQYVEDCAVCCRPNLLTIQISSSGEISLTAEFDG